MTRLGRPTMSTCPALPCFEVSSGWRSDDPFPCFHPAEPLVRSLQQVVAALPDLLPRAQELLLDLLSLVLARRPFSCNAPPVTVQALQAALASGEAFVGSVGSTPLLAALMVWPTLATLDNVPHCSLLPPSPPPFLRR